MGIIRRGGKGGKAGKSAKQTIRYWGIVPAEPTITNVAKVGYAYDNAQYDITFVAGTGIGSTATSFIITASTSGLADVNFTATSSPYRVTGLKSSRSYTFKIKANSNIGDSNEVSSSAQDVTTVPAKPGAPSVSSPSAGSDSVSWGTPANGGSAITSYDWESTDGKSGNTGSTSVSVGQEQGTSQQYRVRANNALGSSEWSDYSVSVTTTFSFVPFSVFGFSPFSVFGFSPFGFSPFSVFGFSPFSVFGFSPFGFSPFGFSPFGFSPFGFSPFGVFGFAPGCIHEDTLISVVSEDGLVTEKAAKDVQTGDYIWAGTFDENIDESIADPYSWTTESVTNLTKIRTNVANIQQKIVAATMTINGDDSMKYSLEQGVFVKRNNVYSYRVTAGLEVGDVVIKFDPTTDSFVEVVVDSIEVTEAEATVYKFDCEPTDTLIAGGLLMHNLKAY